MEQQASNPWDQQKAMVESTYQKAPPADSDDSPNTPWNMMKKAISSGEAFFNEMVGKPAPRPQKVTEAPEKAPVNKFESIFANLIQAESRGRHTDASGNLTTSPVGAQGVTQVMPKTAKDPGYGVAPIKDNSEGEYKRFGREYLTAMLKEFGGDYNKALAAYNHGPGGVRKAIMKAAKAGHDDWLSLTPRETRNYVAKITKGI